MEREDEETRVMETRVPDDPIVEVSMESNDPGGYR